MIINYDENEKKKLNLIRQSYEEILRRLEAEARAAINTPLYSDAVKKLSAAEKALQAELDSMALDFQKERFKDIESAGADTIIENAKEQAQLILKYLQEDLANTYKYMKPEAIKEGLELGKAGILKKDKILLNSNYAFYWIKDELQLHIRALENNREKLTELMEAIIELTETSQYTDNSEITDGKKNPLQFNRFRRSPLKDIKTYGLMNDKVNAQLMQDTEFFNSNANGQLVLKWGINQASKDKQVPVYVALTYTGEGLRITQKLTAFDNAVYNAVSTRFYYWKETNADKPLYISPQEIWRTMNGKQAGDGKAKPSEAQIRKIEESLDKMRFTRIFMNIKAEQEAYSNYPVPNDERFMEGIIDTYLLNSDKAVFVTDKGNKVTGYRISEEPILYVYNSWKDRILYVPYEMLDTSERLSNAENVTEFRNYLLQQVQLMKNAAEKAAEGKKYFNRNNIILLETIYRDTGIMPPEERIEGDYANEATRQQAIRRLRQADRQKIEGILSAWKAKSWVKGYEVLNQNGEPIKERQQAKSFRILL